MYVFCELWSVVIINLLFWQYANHIFNTNSAKRFYPILGMVNQEKIKNNPMARRETLELVRAYYKIPDEDVRKRLYELIRSIGGTGK